MISAPEGFAPIRLLATGAQVDALRAALKANAHLWNERTERTAPEESPHYGLDDIWVRFADMSTMREDGSHDSVWYQRADVLPVHELVRPLMAAVGGERLGGILITRIPPGATCKPHEDPGWHARHYDKYAIQIEADPLTQRFCFDGHELATAPGDVFWFDNAYTHWVLNEGPHERVTLIACIRTEHTGKKGA